MATKSIEYQHLVRKLYSYLNDGFIIPAAGAYAPFKTVVTSLGDYGHSFSTYKGGRYYVVVDRNYLFKNVKPALYPCNDTEIKQVSYDTLMYVMGFFYHELGHIMFTNFNFDKMLLSVPVPDQTGVLQLFNVLEDPFIEAQVKNKIRRSFVYFKFLVEKIFEPNASSYTDDGSLLSFLNYLLFSLRLGRTKVSVPNAFFDAHEADVIGYVQKFYRERDGEVRSAIAVEFYVYLKAQGLDFTTVPAEASASLPTSSGSSAPSSGTSASAGSVAGSLLSRGPSSSGSSSSGSDGDASPATGDDSSISASTGDEDFTARDFDAPSYDGFRSYDAFAASTTPHELASLNTIASIDSKSVSKILQYYDDTVAKFREVINGCTDKIDEVICDKKVLDIPGYSSGRFHLKSYIKGKPLDECFAKPNGVDTVPDLMFGCLLDVSGSMSGHKSAICTQAMIVLFECLSRLSIPFEIGCFTSSNNGVITYIEKGYDDSPELCKANLAFSNDEYYRLYKLPDGYSSFNGNIDEINLAFANSRLASHNRRDKILVVLSDGETCGSTDLLRSTVKSIEASGVTVLGIGISCNSVKEIYTNNIVFSSSADLDNLPEFLGKYLIDLYNK